jgi:uncharacterized cupredoxin-like copper-binding protein
MRTYLSTILKAWIVLVLLIPLWIIAATGVQAKDLSKQNPIVKTVELGTATGLLEFTPSHLSFKNGSLYQLKLSNPSPLKHYFTAKDFADAIWTRKVEVAGAEIKGKISEVELKPGSQLDWLFVPIQSGTYALKCTVPGHAEAGMVGEIVITD